MQLLDVHCDIYNRMWEVLSVSAYLSCREIDVISYDMDHQRKEEDEQREKMERKRVGESGRVLWRGLGVGVRIKSAAVSLILEWWFCSVIVVMQIR